MNSLFLRHLWTPGILGSKLKVWLDASDKATITESGGSVSQWDDKSGNDYHFVQGTGAYQPTTNSRTINGRNAVDFDQSSSQRMLNTSNAAAILPTSTTVHIFCFVQRDTSGTKSDMLLYTYNASGLQAGSTYDGFGGAYAAQCCITDLYSRAIMDLNSGLANPIGTVSVDTNPHIIGAIWKRDTTDSGVENSLDGADHQSEYGKSDDGTAMQTIVLCGNGSTDTALDRLYDGLLGEVVIAHGLTASEILQVEGYLSWRWEEKAILASSHAYRYNPPYA